MKAYGLCVFVLVSASSAEATWTPISSMDGVRISSNSAVLLPDGRAVFASGIAEGGPCTGTVFDPKSDSWTPTALMPPYCHQFSAAALLQDGTVLSVGTPFDDRTAFVLDPKSLAWSLVQSMERQHSSLTLTVLNDGSAMAIGSYDREYETYDPSSATWSCCGQTRFSRSDGTATLLLDGRLFVAGGGILPNSAEIYDPSTGTWSSVPSMASERRSHAAVLLADGRVLVVGGFHVLAPPEIFDPKSRRWSQTSSPRSFTQVGQSLVLLADGRVLLAGGGLEGGSRFSEIFDPVTETWTDAGNMNVARSYPLALRLLDGRVLLAGGMEDWRCVGKSCFATFTSTAEIFTPD